MKRRNVYIALLVSLLCIVQVRSFAQHYLNLYNMELVPQRIFQNPAFIPDHKFYIGIPVLSGIQSSYALPFSYNDAITRGSDDSLTFNISDVLGKLEKNDQLTFFSDVDILSFGTRIDSGRFYLGFSIRERISQQYRIPANLGNFLWYGNAAPQLFGKEVNIAPTVNVTAWDEYAASFSGYAMKGKLTWGARLKYLSGRVNSTTTKADLKVYTDTGTYQMYLKSDIAISTSGLSNREFAADDRESSRIVPGLSNYFDQRVSSLIFPGNNGVGIDVGLSYQVNPHIGISASVLDIGFITWSKNTMTLVSRNPGTEVVFNGVSLNSFIDMLESYDSFGRKLKDSIVNLAKIDTVFGEKYTSWLPVRYNLGGSYLINEHHRFNILFNGISWNRKFYPALSVSYNYQLGGILGLMVSYNIFNRQYTNIGAGLSVKAGPIQLFVMSDNIPGMISYKGSNNYSIQFGLNIVIKGKKAGG
jgi:hypothetical protein